jgi:hypothetical protein
MFFFKGDFWIFFCDDITASSAAPQIQLCLRMPGSNPGQLQLRHWLSDALNHSAIDLIHTRLDLIHNFYGCYMAGINLLPFRSIYHCNNFCKIYFDISIQIPCY